MANGKCHVHGGDPLDRQYIAAQAKGRHGSYIPASLIEMYNSARLDERLLSLEDDIALIDTRIAYLLLRIGEGETPAAWERVRVIAGKLLDANRKIEASRIDEAIGELEDAICAPQDSRADWEEIAKLQEQRRKLSESQRKYEIEQERMIPAEAVLEQARLLLDSIRRNVDDPEVLTRIQADFQAALRSVPSGGFVAIETSQLSES
jgi:hypothetical protein